MKMQTTCPRCQHRLQLASDVDSRWITCPRCLQSIPNPAGLDGGNRPDDEGTYATATEARSCLSCGRTLESDWNRCPYCSGRSRPQRSLLERRPLADLDVERDTSGTNVGLVVLGVLLIAGVILFLTFGGLNLLYASREPRPFLAFAGILLIIFIGGLVAIGVGSHHGTTRILTGVIGGLVTGAAVAFLTIIAICIGIMSTCANWGAPHR
jgi:ribosomal protein S27E